MSNRIVLCSYCKGPAELIDTKELYNGRSYGMAWICRPCNAYVGCHKGTHKPKGSLANEELREWRKDVHGVFDPLWHDTLLAPGQKRKHVRYERYKWLANKLNIPVNDCHIGMFDLEQCKKAYEVCINEHLGTNG